MQLKKCPHETHDTTHKHTKNKKMCTHIQTNKQNKHTHTHTVTHNSLFRSLTLLTQPRQLIRCRDLLHTRTQTQHINAAHKQVHTRTHTHTHTHTRSHTHTHMRIHTRAHIILNNMDFLTKTQYKSLLGLKESCKNHRILDNIARFCIFFFEEIRLSCPDCPSKT